MDKFGKGWFSEVSQGMWDGQFFSMKVKKVILKEKSDYQDILVFESETYGKVLVLDGVIQITERDECAYQEMLTHVPLFEHNRPTRVLLIGGGDGGCLREILKHSCVEKVVMCEIDSKVVEVSKKHFKSIHCGSFDDKRVDLQIRDGIKFLKNLEDEFDVIIVDSSDPVGPAESLYTKDFYELCEKALKKDGILCCQAESIWLHLKNIKEWKGVLEGIFEKTDYFYTMIPTYPSGMIGFLINHKNAKQARNIRKDGKKMKLKYYDEEIHQSSFVLPKFVKDELTKEKR